MPTVGARATRPYLPECVEGSATSSPGPGRKVITHKLVSSPGPKRRYERACGDLGDAALACKVDYTLRNARGLKECKLPVKNRCQPCGWPSWACGAEH